MDDDSIYDRCVAENLNTIDMDELLLPKLHDRSSVISNISSDMDRQFGLRMEKMEDYRDPLPAFSTSVVDMTTAPDTPSRNDFSFMVPSWSEGGDNLGMIIDDKADFSVNKVDSGTPEKPEYDKQT